MNVFATAAYILGMRKRIKLTGFKDWVRSARRSWPVARGAAQGELLLRKLSHQDTMFYNNLISIPILVVASIVLEGWGADNFEHNL